MKDLGEEDEDRTQSRAEVKIKWKNDILRILYFLFFVGSQLNNALKYIFNEIYLSFVRMNKETQKLLRK